MMPFTINRQSQVSLTDQVYAGFRRAIQAGHYRTGDTMPTIEQSAAALGISNNVMKTVIKRLSCDGLVTARPRRGIEVAPSNHHRWQAHVLYLHWGSANSYYEAVSSETVMQQLIAKQVLVTPFHLAGAEVASEFPRLKSVIHSGPIDMAVLAGPVDQIAVFLAENEIPFVHLSGLAMSPPSRLARRTLVQDARPALEQAVQHAVACGVRSLMTVGEGGGGGEMKGIAEAAGLAVRFLAAPRIEGVGMPECIHRGGMEALVRFLGSGESLPDLIYFSDDFTAQGALTALLAHGIRIPEGVQVISWANRNLGPVFPKPLTRIEMDPERDGEALANLVEEALKKPDRKVKGPVVIGPEFVVGETTRAVASNQ